MAPPVWVLSVDLQTKTATFTSGLADAAKGARGSFNDIKTSAAEAWRGVSFSMMEARHSVMILGEEFGVKIPRALSGFVASLGPIGPAMEAAFPFMAIALGATIFIEHLRKANEEAEKLALSQEGFHTAIQKTFNALDQKLLEAQIRTDELNKDHLGELKHRLELINSQSLEDLAHQFESIDKGADDVFKHLQSHWYTAGVGAEGARSSLERFKSEFESLLARGDKAGAHSLLENTLRDNEKILAAQKTLEAHRADVAVPGKRTLPLTRSNF